MNLAVTHQSLDEVSSLAYQRLQVVLGMWEKDKLTMPYKYMWVCARKHGAKLKSIWLDTQDDTYSKIDQEYKYLLCKATSFEVEFLFDPEKRSLSLTKKNQWNSLRGKRAVLIRYQGLTTQCSSLEMIARNTSFQRIGLSHVSQASSMNKSGIEEQLERGTKQVPITLYKTRQYLCTNKRNQGTLKFQEAQPEDLYRGNQIVNIENITRESFLATVKSMSGWLACQVDKQGKAEYKYWPSRGVYSTSNNAIRQWMATVCLNRAALAFKSQSLRNIAANNLAYNLRTTFKSASGLGYIFMNGSAKLGAASLAALAILESPDRKKYLSHEYALTNLIDHLSNKDGSFDTFYIPRDRTDNQNFYSGEALLFLASRYVISRNPEELKRFMDGFRFYRKWHIKCRNPAFVPWHTQAYFLVWEVTKDEDLKEFIFEMNDWLLSMQQWESVDYADMKGRFYNPNHPYYGPPHASSTGVYLEGLSDAYLLAKKCGDSKRIERYRIAIVRGLRSIMQLQYKNEIDAFYINDTAKVIGGVRTTVYDNTIRIDNVQHALMAFFKINARFTDIDFQVASAHE